MYSLAQRLSTPIPLLLLRLRFLPLPSSRPPPLHFPLPRSPLSLALTLSFSPAYSSLSPPAPPPLQLNALLKISSLSSPSHAFTGCSSPHTSLPHLFLVDVRLRFDVRKPLHHLLQKRAAMHTRRDGRRKGGINIALLCLAPLPPFLSSACPLALRISALSPSAHYGMGMLPLWLWFIHATAPLPLLCLALFSPDERVEAELLCLDACSACVAGGVPDRLLDLR